MKRTIDDDKINDDMDLHDIKDGDLDSYNNYVF